MTEWWWRSFRSPMGLQTYSDSEGPRTGSGARHHQQFRCWAELAFRDHRGRRCRRRHADTRRRALFRNLDSRSVVQNDD